MRSKALENARVRKSPSNRIITLITCTPRHSTKQRWVWWGQLTEVRDAGDSPL
jgi:sortase (surface protein transpeptidase)